MAGGIESAAPNGGFGRARAPSVARSYSKSESSTLGTMATRALTAILSPFRRSQKRGLDTAHTALSTTALTDNSETRDKFVAWHSWRSELNLAIDASVKKTVEPKPKPASRAIEAKHVPPPIHIPSNSDFYPPRTPTSRLKRSASQTLRRWRSPPAPPSTAVTLYTPTTPAAPPQIALEFDWGKSASDLPCDALCTVPDPPPTPFEELIPVMQPAPPLESISTAPSSVIATPLSTALVRKRGVQPLDPATVAFGIGERVPILRRIGSKRAQRRGPPPPPTEPMPLPRIEMDLVEEGFDIDFGTSETLEEIDGLAQLD